MSLVKDLGLEKSHLKSDFLEGNHVLLSCCHPGRAQPPTEILTPPWACEVVTPEVQLLWQEHKYPHFSGLCFLGGNSLSFKSSELIWLQHNGASTCVSSLIYQLELPSCQLLSIFSRHSS